ncbi:uncharacterized protein Z520_08366 [Fonsecaea multimorphosa CBS 102226]|uniref:Uncharacterized protein n=1 Tax=Fonsecaea multimorphosa CBS 102226 TaxID=1442371 RepID=A0A0D2IGC7_9EURO|nr:uncharacterized protein Z520_08366 [Fonsecaea multimorphosa CBS 102226]KIX96111.1 hypothetical protein Z520_08366 [Fonsecaea multimorphosa CBS 102226]OAL19157.1 hypothetical protein AYO22_10105 [Fonsecaea multimorphosa]
MAYWHDRLATGCRSAPPSSMFKTIVGLLLLTASLLPRVTSALQSVAGSPCESVCANAGSLEQDVLCLDADYQSLPSGRAFQNCVACQLNSTAVDTAKNETDVEWALLALRYTLAGCMFAIPEDHVSISSPCQVSCASLNASIGYQVTNNTSKAQPGNAFCTADPFDDYTINKCALCYSYIPQQLYQANFLQALHIACRQPPVPGKPFFPDAQSIFNETLIAGPAAPSGNTGGHGGLHGWKLALAIVLPVVGGIILLVGACWGCFAFTRKRRQRMAQTGRMSRVHDAHADSMYYSPMSAKAEAWKAEDLPWGVSEPPREMHAISQTMLHAKHSPGVAQGRWSHQTGGTGGGPGSEQNTPLRSSFQREDVGPGPEQVRDPNLHDQFFGIDEEADDLPGPSGGHEYYPEHHEQSGGGGHEFHPQQIHQQHGLGQLRMPDDERGNFI